MKIHRAAGLIEDDSFPAESGNGKATRICRQYIRGLWRTVAAKQTREQTVERARIGSAGFLDQPTDFMILLHRRTVKKTYIYWPDINNSRGRY